MSLFGYPLHLAVIQNRIDDLHGNLLRCPPTRPAPDFIDRMDLRGNTALHYAAAENRIEFIVPLLSYGANINAQNHEGATPLFLSVERGNLFVVSLLCEHGADVHLSNIRNLLSPLHVASSLGRSDIAAQLLRYGASLFALDEEEDTPLHWAVREERFEFVRTMFEYLEMTKFGQQQQQQQKNKRLMCAQLINFRNSDGESPFDLACCFELRDMVALMESKLVQSTKKMANIDQNENTNAVVTGGTIPGCGFSSHPSGLNPNWIGASSDCASMSEQQTPLGFSFLISGAQQFLNGQNKISVR